MKSIIIGIIIIAFIGLGCGPYYTNTTSLAYVLRSNVGNIQLSNTGIFVKDLNLNIINMREQIDSNEIWWMNDSLGPFIGKSVFAEISVQIDSFKIKTVIDTVTIKENYGIHHYLVFDTTDPHSPKSMIKIPMGNLAGKGNDTLYGVVKTEKSIR